MTALAFDAFTSIAYAIEQAASTRSSNVRDALLATVIEGVTGKTAFTKEGDAVKRPFLYRVGRDKNKGRQAFILLKPAFN